MIEWCTGPPIHLSTRESAGNDLAPLGKARVQPPVWHRSFGGLAYWAVRVKINTITPLRAAEKRELFLLTGEAEYLLLYFVLLFMYTVQCTLLLLALLSGLSFCTDEVLAQDSVFEMVAAMGFCGC